MITTKLKKLKREEQMYLGLLEDLHYSDNDPNVIAVYQSDLHFAIACIQEQIEFERKMLPFKYMILGFVIIEICLIAFSLIFN